MTRDYIILRKFGEVKFHGFKKNPSIHITNAARVQQVSPETWYHITLVRIKPHVVQRAMFEGATPNEIFGI